MFEDAADGASPSAKSANFNFNWMMNYMYADDGAPVFPKGTVIERHLVWRESKLGGGFSNRL